MIEYDLTWSSHFGSRGGLLFATDANPRLNPSGLRGGARSWGAFFENAFFEILQIFGGLVLGCIKTKFC